MCNLEGLEEADLEHLAEYSTFLQESVPAQVPADLEALKTEAYHDVLSKAEKTLARKRKAHDSTEKRAKRQKPWTPTWAAENERKSGEVRDPGQALLVDPEQKAKDFLKRQGFTVHELRVQASTYPCFLQAAVKQSARRIVGHAIVIPSLLNKTSGAVAAARLLGAFLCEPQKVVGAQVIGIQYKVSFSKRPRFIHVSDKVVSEHQGLETILAEFCKLPGSKLQVGSEADVQKEYTAYRQQRGIRSKPWMRLRCVLTQDALNQCASTRKKFPNLYCTWHDFLEFLTEGVSREAIMPGRP